MDPKNDLTFATLFAAKSQTNNTGSAGVDLSAFQGVLAVDINIGAPTAGDAADRAISIALKSSATNNVSNATNISGVSPTNTTNNASASVVAVDTRVALRYLFAVPTVSGTNSPAYPLSVRLLGRKQQQG